MKVNKAVIAAAGRGTRFLPVVKSYPKELVPVLAKPNLQYLVEEALSAGIKNIAIVHRDGETAIENYFTPDLELENYLKENNKTDYLKSLQAIWDTAKIDFIVQPHNLPYGSASPALAAHDYIKNEPFVYMYGDDLIVEPKPGQFLSEMLATFEKYQPDAVIATQEVPWLEINRYGCIKYKENPQYPNQIEMLLEKMSPETAPSNNALLGRFVVSPKILEYTKNQSLSRDNELWWTESINHYAQVGTILNQTIRDGQWMTTGDPLRWLKVNISFALKDPKMREEISQYLESVL
jgi:UTP--glucose-1-phosphate uridylyltransferase